MMGRFLRVVWILTTGFLVITMAAQGVWSITVNEPSSAEVIKIPINKSHLITLKIPAERVSVVAPAIADVQVLDPTQTLVTGKTVGETSLIIWMEGGSTRMFSVQVQWNIELIYKALEQVMPAEPIEIIPIENGIALKGYVSKVELADQALEIAKLFVPKVINLLEVPGIHQVLLKVKVAEVARSFRENLGADFYFNNYDFYTGSAAGNISSGNLDGSGQLTATDAANLFFGLQNGRVSTFVQALQEKGLLEMLAEPNLVARSGETASFLAGGEIPIPVVQSGGGTNNSISVQYKEYGVQLNFTPTVLSDTTIRMDVSPEVSDLDFGQGVQISGFTIPAILTRRAHTVVKMETGQTFAIAGLINQKKSKTRKKTPVIGNIPVLGNMFKTRNIQADETELLILVTPEIVSPLKTEQAQIKIADPFKTTEGPNDLESSMLYLKTQKVVGHDVKAATESMN